MASIQEQLQKKRVPIDTWSLREKLCLASAVLRSGDQNWMSVSRAMKVLGDPSRPPDWYSQKNCAAQYGLLLENVETPKRKKRTTGSDQVTETPGKSIVNRLTQERLAELKKVMLETKQQYSKIKLDIKSVYSDNVSMQQLKEMCLQIEQDKKQKEREAILHAEWLKEREEKKLELERAWRPFTKINTSVNTSNQKRKLLDANEGIQAHENNKNDAGAEDIAQDANKPGMSPLLTSLLKSPSPAPNASILHSAITNSQRGTSPTIASLLSTSPEVVVSPSLQQLVCTAIGQEPGHMTTSQSSGAHVTSERTPTMPHQQSILNINQTVPLHAQTSVVGTDSLPLNIKTEVDTNLCIKSVNIEEEIQLVEEVLKEVEESENKELLERNAINVISSSEPKTDIINELNKTEEIVSSNENNKKIVETAAAPPSNEILELDNNSSKASSDDTVIKEKVISISDSSNSREPEESALAKKSEQPVIRNVSVLLEELDQTQDVPEVKKEPGTEVQRGSVEIVEILVKDEENSDETNDTLSEMKESLIREKSLLDEQSSINERKEDEKSLHAPSVSEQINIKTEIKEEIPEDGPQESDSKDSTDNLKSDDTSNDKIEMQNKIDIDAPISNQKTTITSELTEADFDEMTIEVIKSDKAKRDYSRKKREESEIDIILASDKEDTNDAKDCLDSLTDLDKKTDAGKVKIKMETDRSDSPLTEEDNESSFIRTRRRYSTPATPSDSVPNSPASSIAGFEDDRDYRAWKKSVMLVYNRLATHKYASLFLKPITEDQAPGYHSMIHRPRDLQTLRKHIESGHIKTTKEFILYVLTMFQNAVMFNKANDYVYNMAREMQDECMQQIQLWVQAQAQETPARRETRTSEPGVKRVKREELPVKGRKRKFED